MKKFENIKHIVWDLDGTLYPKNEAYYNADFKTLAEIIADMSVMPEDQAFEKAKESKIKYGYTYDIFTKEHGVDFNKLDEAFCANLTTDFLQRDQSVVELMKQISDAGYTQMLLSYARKDWINKVIKKIGVEKFLTPVITMSELNVYKKESADTRKGSVMNTVCRSLGINPAEVLTVDDEVKNFDQSRNYGIRTVLINGQNSFPQKINTDIKPDFIYPTIVDFMKDLLSNKTKGQ